MVNVESPSQILSLAAPWFLQFQADSRFRIILSAEDLQRATG